MRRARSRSASTVTESEIVETLRGVRERMTARQKQKKERIDIRAGKGAK